MVAVFVANSIPPPMSPPLDKGYRKDAPDAETLWSMLDEVGRLIDLIDGSQRRHVTGMLPTISALQLEVLRLQSRVLYLSILTGILLTAIVFLVLGLMQQGPVT